VGSNPIDRPIRSPDLSEKTVTYEALDQWQFVAAAYGLGVVGTLGLVVWSWLAMRRAERRRERSRSE
jgi:hypothetical protein